jgi:hypothetical protein
MKSLPEIVHANRPKPQTKPPTPTSQVHAWGCTSAACRDGLSSDVRCIGLRRDVVDMLPRAQPGPYS